MSNQASDNTHARDKERPLWLTEVMRKTLTDCTEAQHVAMQQSLELFERTLFTHDDGRTEPVMVSFSLQMNGQDCTLRIPLLALVPLPFMQISQANLDFYVNVMSSESRKWQGLEVRFSPSNERIKCSGQTQYKMSNNIRVNIKAAAALPSGGMARLLQIAGSKCMRVKRVEENAEEQ